MRLVLAFVAASVVTIFAARAPSYAGQAPFSAAVPDVPVSHQDRVYAAEHIRTLFQLPIPSITDYWALYDWAIPAPRA